MRIAIYARTRITGGTQTDHDLHLANQIHDVAEWATANNHVVVVLFTDKGTSALDEGRPAFKQMMEQANTPRPPFDCIAVHSYSRLHRDAIKLGHLMLTLSRRNVQVISITQSDRGDSDIGQRIISAFAEFCRPPRE